MARSGLLRPDPKLGLCFEVDHSEFDRCKVVYSLSYVREKGPKTNVP